MSLAKRKKTNWFSRHTEARRLNRFENDFTRAQLFFYEIAAHAHECATEKLYIQYGYLPSLAVLFFLLSLRELICCTVIRHVEAIVTSYIMYNWIELTRKRPLIFFLSPSR